MMVNPIELKYLEDLILLRLPLRRVPASLLERLSQPLPPATQSQILPSGGVDMQIERAPGSRDLTPDANRLPTPGQQTFSLSNPSAFPVDMFGIGGVPFNSSCRWYNSPQAMAACQLMYRSLLGFYSIRRNDLKIKK